MRNVDDTKRGIGGILRQFEEACVTKPDGLISVAIHGKAGLDGFKLTEVD